MVRLIIILLETVEFANAPQDLRSSSIWVVCSCDSHFRVKFSDFGGFLKSFRTDDGPLQNVPSYASNYRNNYSILVILMPS